MIAIRTMTEMPKTCEECFGGGAPERRKRW